GGSNRSPFGEGRQDGILETTPYATSGHDGRARRAAAAPGARGRRRGGPAPPPAQGRAPAWRFAPAQLNLDAGGTLAAQNRGGEDHTFTEVANFGGGCIQALNDLLGLTPVPEGAGFPRGGLAATTVAPGGTLTTAPLPPGVHRYECLIHPWMRTTA